MADWFREYSAGSTVRFFALFALWIVYALVPYKLPTASLLIVTGLLVAYGMELWRHGDHFMGGMIYAAAALNTLLVPYFNAKLNLFLTIVITAILLFDIISSK